jgi:hypothetical protein
MSHIECFATKAVHRDSFLVWFLMAAMLTVLLAQINITSYAETGKGADLFKVIMTVFGVENTKALKS